MRCFHNFLWQVDFSYVPSSTKQFVTLYRLAQTISCLQWLKISQVMRCTLFVLWIFPVVSQWGNSSQGPLSRLSGPRTVRPCFTSLRIKCIGLSRSKNIPPFILLKICKFFSPKIGRPDFKCAIDGYVTGPLIFICVVTCF